MTRADKKMKCKDCLSYHPLSKKTGWCGLWGTAARSGQSCIQGKERPNGIKVDSGQREITGD